jgi:mRNA-degrading endonuclease RelE of RelBE toxin-antitoxin system
MTYGLVYTRRAEKDIKKLDPSIKKLIGKAITGDLSTRFHKYYGVT